jgi:acetyl esterase/lipase
MAEDAALDPGRLVVGGASSGGGAAAGLALLARDRSEVPLAGQLLVYPMLDDREVTASSREVLDPRLWNHESNRLGWAAYLSGLDGAEVPAYAAPARATDVHGLPPTWLATGELDLFRDEDLEYASRLLASGVPTELHVYAGAVHGFDLFAPEAAVSRRYCRDRDEAFDRFVGVVPPGSPEAG